jgi:quercetin dioxygenase-like cupin family protein
MKPIAKTQSCEASHTQYVVSGRVRVKMNDGSEEEYGPGDVLYILPGHNTWVVGNESYTGIEIATMDNYAKK